MSASLAKDGLSSNACISGCAKHTISIYNIKECSGAANQIRARRKIQPLVCINATGEGMLVRRVRIEFVASFSLRVGQTPFPPANRSRRIEANCLGGFVGVICYRH